MLQAHFGSTLEPRPDPAKGFTVCTVQLYMSSCSRKAHTCGLTDTPRSLACTFARQLRLMGVMSPRRVGDTARSRNSSSFLRLGLQSRSARSPPQSYMPLRVLGRLVAEAHKTPTKISRHAPKEFVTPLSKQAHISLLCPRTHALSC